MVKGPKGKLTGKAHFPLILRGDPGGRYWIRTSDARLVKPVLYLIKHYFKAKRLWDEEVKQGMKSRAKWEKRLIL